jgi:hypothetical protein
MISPDHYSGYLTQGICHHQPDTTIVASPGERVRNHALLCQHGNSSAVICLRREIVIGVDESMRSSLIAQYRSRATKVRSQFRQLFSRYPVLKIHATTARQIAKNPKVIARLTLTLTSEVP